MFRLKWLFCSGVLSLLSLVSFTLCNAASLPGVCQSGGCHLAAKHILSKLDTSVDPCEDFYQFACGNYLSENATKSKSVTNDMQTEMYSAIGKSLEKITSQNSYFRHLKEYLSKCQNSGNICDFIFFIEFLNDFHNLTEANKENEYAAMRAFLTSIGGAHLLGLNKEEALNDVTFERRAAQLLPFNTDFFFDFTGFIKPVNVPFGKITFNDELLKLTEAEKEDLHAFRAKLRKLFIRDSGSISSNGTISGYSFCMKEYFKSKTNGNFPVDDNDPVLILNKDYFLFVNETYQKNKKLVLDYQIVSLVESFSNLKRISCYAMAVKEMYPLIDALVARKFTLDP